MDVMNESSDQHWMRLALTEAKVAEAAGEVPVGAVITYKNELLASGYNQPISSRDPSAHAEIVTLRQAAALLGNYRLVGCSLYVTLEPCAMCAGALVHARIQRLVYGAKDPKGGAVSSVFSILEPGKLNHRVDYKEGVLQEECGLLLSEFFRKRR